MTKRRAALGFTVRTGRAVVVAVAGTRGSQVSDGAPEIVRKTGIDVAHTFEEGAVFHAAQDLGLEEARDLVRDAEARFVKKARAALAELVAILVADLDVVMVAAGMAAPAAKTLPPLETIVRAHPLVHAAEGELYRRVFAAAAASLGLPPVRAAPAVLAAGIAAAIGTSEAQVVDRLAAMGRASGRPWAADQKQAALAGWLALASS